MNNIKGKKILILGANPETAGLVIKCNELGVDTYVTDYNPYAFAKRYAKHPLNIDATDVKSLEDLIRKEKIDGVICGVAESLMRTYAKICDDFSFPCYGNKELFNIFVNKENFKNICKKFNAPVVEDYHLCNYSDEELKKIKMPVVVKPVDSCSSKGIAICTNLNELKSGIKGALENSKSKRILIEKYMTGDEVIVYYAFQDGKPFLVSMCDRYTNKDQKGVAQLPTSYIFPSKYLKEYQKTYDEIVKKMFVSLNIKNGFMFIQSFIDEKGKVRFYEPGYRLNGAQEHYIVSKTTGIDAKECLINLALSGKESDIELSSLADPFLNGKYGCKLSPLIKLGKINKIVGLDSIQKIKNVVSINPSYIDGDEVTGYGTLKQIVCRFFIVADTKEELKQTIDEIYEIFDVLDMDGKSMLMTKFDSSIILKNYE